MIGKVLGENAVPTATPSLAEETHAESAEDAGPEPHAESEHVFLSSDSF